MSRERIRVAVVGLNFGSWMIKNELLSPEGAANVEIVAVCDMQQDKVLEWSNKLNVPGYTDLDAVLADPRVEAVALFSGPAGRAKLIDQIIEAGKHVLTTKPFETNSAAARAVLRKAAKLGRVIQLNSPAPELTNDLQQVQRWIEEYDLGRPIAFRAETTSSYREQPNGSWYDDPELCPVAPLFRLGIYVINDCLRFFGEAESVTVQQSRLFTGRPTPDNAQLGIQFKNGAIGNVFASFCIADKQYYKSAFVMNFERGTIYRNMEPQNHSDGRQPKELRLVATRDGEQVFDAATCETKECYQWSVFHDTIRGLRTEDPAYADHIVAGLQLIEMMKATQSQYPVREAQLV